MPDPILKHPTRYARMRVIHLEEGDHVLAYAADWVGYHRERRRKIYPRVDGVDARVLRVHVVLDGWSKRYWRWSKVWKVIE